METTQEKSSVRYTEEQIKDYVEQWKSSGKSQISFSKVAGINYYTFNKWLADWKRKSKIVKERKKACPEFTEGGFAPIKVLAEGHIAFAEIKREGYSVLIFQPVSADYLRSLLK